MERIRTASGHPDNSVPLTQAARRERDEGAERRELAEDEGRE